jgi:anti-sigma-K factor RskA
MADERIHELTAAYALDALDEGDERAYEEHLGTCERCREELAGLQETASLLAYAVEAPEPPAELRARILEQARGEPSNVVPLRPRRRLTQALGAVAAVAAAAAIGLAIWATSLSQELDETRDANRVLADPQAESIALEGADGRLVVTPDGDAALVVAGLDQAPSGKAYEVWVIGEGADPEPAGLFDGRDESDVVLLDRDVPDGATVAVTLEDEEGAPAPTSDPLFAAST